MVRSWLKKLMTALFLGLGVFSASLTTSLIASLATSPQARADMTMTGASSTLTISPTRQELTLEPGQSYTLEISVTNAGNDVAAFVPAAGPYYPTTDGSLDYNASNDHTMLWNWISFSEQSFTLDPGEKATLTFTINVPADAPGGGQYAAVYAEIHASEGGINSVSRVGSLIVGRVNGEIIERGELISQSLPTVVLNGNFTPSATVKNTGNVNFAVSSQLRIKNILSGNIIFDGSAGESDQQQVYPDMTRTFSYDQVDLPAIGIFDVEYTVSFVGQTATLHRVVWAIPLWLLLVVIGVLAFLVIFGWLAFAHNRLAARRKRKASQSGNDVL